MRALLSLAVLSLLPLAASAQSTASVPFEVGFTVSRSPTVGGTAGDENQGTVPAVVLTLDASGEVARRGPVGVRLGGVLRGAATEFVDVGWQTPAGQHVAGYVAVETIAGRGARATALVGASVDLGPTYIGGGGGGVSLASDTQHALWLGGRYATDVSGLTFSAGAEVFHTLLRSTTLPFLTIDDPNGSDSTVTFRSDFGDTVNAYVGVGHQVGPLDVSLTLQISSRARAFYEVIAESGRQLEPTVRNPGAAVVSLVPSVVYRATSGLWVEASVRAPGVFRDEHAVYGVPLVVQNTRVAALPLSLRVGYGW